MPLDFLAIGRGFGPSLWQVQKLWERLTDDPQYHLASEPGRWLRSAFRREAAVLQQAKRSSMESLVPVPGRGGHHDDSIGKRTLVEAELSGRGSPHAVEVGKGTPVEAELLGRGSPYALEAGKRTLTLDLLAHRGAATNELPLQSDVAMLLAAIDVSAKPTQATSATLTFVDFHATALADVLSRLGASRLRDAMLTAADPLVARRVSRREHQSERSLDPHLPVQHGHAMWGVAKARAVTLYRRAKAEGTAAPETPEVAAALDAIGSGVPLPPEVLRELETTLRASLSNVRLHTGAVAVAACQAVNAEAFTVGEDVFYPEFNPASRESLKTLAHECVHTLQWQAGRTATTADTIEVSKPDHALEREAESVVERAFSDPSSIDGVRGHGPSGLASHPPHFGAERGAEPGKNLGRTANDTLTPGSVEHATRGGGNAAVLWRKPLRYESPRAGAAARKADDHELVPATGKPWKVFATTGKPYIIETRGGRPGAWVVRDWVRKADDLKSVKVKDERGRVTNVVWSSPSRARSSSLRSGGSILQTSTMRRGT